MLYQLTLAELHIPWRPEPYAGRCFRGVGDLPNKRAVFGVLGDIWGVLWEAAQPSGSVRPGPSRRCGPHVAHLDGCVDAKRLHCGHGHAGHPPVRRWGAVPLPPLRVVVVRHPERLRLLSIAGHRLRRRVRAGRHLAAGHRTLWHTARRLLQQTKVHAAAGGEGHHDHFTHYGCRVLLQCYFCHPTTEAFRIVLGIDGACGLRSFCAAPASRARPAAPPLRQHRVLWVVAGTASGFCEAAGKIHRSALDAVPVPRRACGTGDFGGGGDGVLERGSGNAFGHGLPRERAVSGQPQPTQGVLRLGADGQRGAGPVRRHHCPWG
mmetsp:Transcript_66973/g.205103  ORF Transcript_66973/g.205103 Transcript_66973/m.205103 type:complete len:321 (+) Transcript_66973:736-1698(+)